MQGHCTELLSLIDAQRAATETARQTATSATAEARKLAARDEAWTQQQRNWQRERADLLARLDGLGDRDRGGSHPAPFLNASSSGSLAYFQHQHNQQRASISSGGGIGAYPAPSRASYQEHTTTRARPPLAAAAPYPAAAPQAEVRRGGEAPTTRKSAQYDGGGYGSDRALPGIGGGAAEALHPVSGNGKEN